MINEEKTIDDSSSKKSEIKDTENENEHPSYSLNENIKNPQPFYLMTLEDNLGNCQQIKIFKNSNPSELAFNFCKENNLDFTAMKYIKSNIKDVLKKFDETNNSIYNNNDQIKEEENEDECLTEGTLKSNEKVKKNEIENNTIVPENSKTNTEIIESKEITDEEFFLPKKENNNINKNKNENSFKINKISPRKREINEKLQKLKNFFKKNKNFCPREKNNLLNIESISNKEVKISDDNGESYKIINEKSFSEQKNTQSKLTESGVPVLNNQIDTDNEDCFLKNKKYENKSNNMKDFEKEEDITNKTITMKNKFDTIGSEQKDYSIDLNPNFDSESIDLIKFNNEKNSNNYAKIKTSLMGEHKEKSYLKLNKNKKFCYSNQNLNYNNKIINDTDFLYSSSNFDKNNFNNNKYNTKKENKSKSVNKNKQKTKKKNMIFDKSEKNFEIIENFLGKLIKINNETANLEKNAIRKKNSKIQLNIKFPSIQRSTIESFLNKNNKKDKGCKTPPIKNSIKMHKLTENNLQNSIENGKSRNKYFSKNCNKIANQMSKSASELIDYKRSKILSSPLTNKIIENYIMNNSNNSMKFKLNKNLKQKIISKQNNTDKKNLGKYTINLNPKNICFKRLNRKIKPCDSKQNFIQTDHNTLCNFNDEFNSPSFRENSKILKKMNKNFFQDLTNVSKEFGIQEKYISKLRKHCISHVNRINNNKLNSYGSKMRTILINKKIFSPKENMFDLSRLLNNKIRTDRSKDMKNINRNKIINDCIYADSNSENLNINKNNSKDKIQKYKKLEKFKKSMKKLTTKNKNEEKDSIKKSMKDFVNRLISNNESVIPKYIKNNSPNKQKTNLTFYNNNNNNLFININGEINQNDEKVNDFFSKIFCYITKNKSKTITLMNGSFNEKINLLPSQIKNLLMKMINIIYLNKINSHNLSVINSNKNKNSAIKNKEQVTINKNNFVNEMSYIYKYYLNKDSKNKLMLFRKELNKFIQNDILDVNFHSIPTINNFRFEAVLPFTPENKNDNKSLFKNQKIIYHI